MPPSDNKATHIVFSGLPDWGHVRPFCVLAARLVKENKNTFVTMLISPTLLVNAQKEASAELRGESTEDISKRLRILSSFKSNGKDMLSLVIPLAQTFVTSYQALCEGTAQTFGASYQALSEGKSIVCAVSGQTFEAIIPPNVVVLDFFAHAQMLATRAITGASVPIVAWLTGHAAPIIRLFGPAKFGGRGELASIIEEEAKRLGVSAQEIEDKVYNHIDGTVVKIPGLPDMYDWEHFPQTPPVPFPFAEITKMGHAGLKECDQVIATTTYSFERESLQGLKSWFSDWSKGVSVIGPLLPSGYGTVAENPRGSDDIKVFLDKRQVECGLDSVVLISFGSIFWPPVPEYIEELIEALIEKKYPFILSTASPVTKLSDGLIEKIRSSGLGIISAWCPQQYILNHPATGWFVTHCGHNSVMETIASGIPMICWPLEADQPAAAVHLSDNLKVAFELIEVRTGENGLKPMCRNGRAAKGTREAVGVEIREVLDACRGERGDEVRRNVKFLKSEFGEAWGPDGISRKELTDFFKKYSRQSMRAYEKTGAA